MYNVISCDIEWARSQQPKEFRTFQNPLVFVAHKLHTHTPTHTHTLSLSLTQLDPFHPGNETNMNESNRFRGLQIFLAPLRPDLCLKSPFRRLSRFRLLRAHGQEHGANLEPRHRLQRSSVRSSESVGSRWVGDEGCGVRRAAS